MLFSIIWLNLRECFGEVFINLVFIEENEGSGEFLVEIKIFRGLFYVYLYLVLEKVINEIIE